MAQDNTKDSGYNVYPEVQERIDKAIKRDESNRQYLKEIEELFLENIHTNSVELNDILMEALTSIEKIDDITQKDLQIAVDKQNELFSNTLQTKGDWTEAYNIYMAIYMKGINVVKKRNCPQTAKYMEHAIVPVDKVQTSWKPTTYYHNNDSWAEELAITPDLFDEMFYKFEEQILNAGKTSGTVNGSFAFTTSNSSLDAFASLHKVNYSVTFVKQTSGGYVATLKITDTYDFEWGNYESFEIGFGNNYCVMMQNNRWIRPFTISITAKL